MAMHRLVDGPDGPLQVRTDALRGHAGELTDAGHRLDRGLTGIPGLVVAAPDGAAAGALAALESAVHAWFGGVGGRLARTAEGLRAAAVGYDAADARAAARLARAGTAR